MFWLIPLLLCLGLVVLVVAVFVGAVRNARALKRDVNERFTDIQGKLEKQANALADELFAQKKDTTE
jgi:sensor domain CHASE-containing protein